MKVRLHHFSFVKDAVGGPGDVVTVSDKQGEQMIASRGATKIESAKRTPKEPKDPKEPAS